MNDSETTNPDVVIADDPVQNDAVKTLEERLDDILDSFLSTDVVPLKEGISTRLKLNAEANVLHDVDLLTQRMCSVIERSQSQGLMQISISDFGVPLIVVDSKRKLPLSELTRIRKQYVQWVNTHPMVDSSQRGIATSFLQYLEAQM